MSWARIMAPLAGVASDALVLEAARAFAAPLGAEVAAVFAPADAADLMPWMGEGFMGGVQIAALDSLKEAAQQGDVKAKVSFNAAGCPRASYVTLSSPVAAGLAMEARLSDVVVFSADGARGRGPLTEAFQQVLMEERRPVLIARNVPDPAQTVAVAWDGGREATRAARLAVPWLQHAAKVVILTAPAATPRAFDAHRLVDIFAARGVKAEVETLSQVGEPGPLLVEGASRVGASLLVAGAFGHPRFQQFIFGGTTRHLMHTEAGPSLFLAH